MNPLLACSITKYVRHRESVIPVCTARDDTACELSGIKWRELFNGTLEFPNIPFNMHTAAQMAVRANEEFAAFSFLRCQKVLDDIQNVNQKSKLQKRGTFAGTPNRTCTLEESQKDASNAMQAYCKTTLRHAPAAT